jgi:vanillate O-demethylase monooxygenase subunit
MTFPKNLWYVAFWSADLNDQALHPRRILDEPIVFYRSASGEVIALEDTCPHRFAPLSLGTVVEGDRVQCAYHGLRFDRTGACVYNPHTDHKIPPAATVRAYTVVEKHSLVWIWLGTGVPDPQTIPDYSCLDTARPEHISTRNHMTIAADYRLIVDNLLDLSHVPFLHAGVILDTGVREPGTAKEDGTGYFGLHLLTPETATSTHYHFAAVRFNAPPRSLEEDLAIRETVSAGRKYAFEAQDAPVIEAQQRRMNEIGDRRPTLLAVDAGAVRVQRILARLVAAEATIDRPLVHAGN